MASEYLPAGWALASLKDVAADVRYGYTASATADPAGPRFLRITDIVGDHLDWAAVPHCKIDRKGLDKHRLEHGDIVVARTGASAGASHYCDPPELSVFASYLVRFRTDRAAADPRFVAYALQSPAWSEFVAASATGSAQPQLNATVMGTFRFPLAPLGEQTRVAAVLGALDDKIDSNRRLARLLEETALTLFRARFVNLAEAQQFDGRERPLREVTLMIQRGRAPSYCEVEGTLVVNQKCVRDGKIDFGKARRHDSAARPVAEERMLLPDDVLVNSTGVGTLGRIAPVRWVPEPATVDGHVTVVRPDPSAIAPGYLALELATRQAEIEGLAEGSTGQTELSRSRLAELTVRVPTRSAQEEFARISTPATAQIAAREREAGILAAIRDLLLPKLISGQIRVRETADPDEVIDPVAEEIAVPAP